MKTPLLLVEDDAKLRRTLATWIGRAGYDVTQAPDGEAAIKLLMVETFAVVVSDIVMGGIDGLGVLQAAGRLRLRPAVILLTGQGTLESAMAALRAGAFDYLLKPCSGDELLMRIAAAVTHVESERQLRSALPALSPVLSLTRGAARMPNEAPDGFIRLGELEIGPSRLQVSLRSAPVALTRIEYILLRCLAERPGQLCRYSELAWASHQLAMDDGEARDLLRTHLHNLRSKVGRSYFQVDAGAGCMLAVPTFRSSRLAV
jgi:DNA-binding response OmpR family regulator